VETVEASITAQEKAVSAQEAETIEVPSERKCLTPCAPSVVPIARFPSSLTAEKKFSAVNVLVR